MKFFYLFLIISLAFFSCKKNDNIAVKTDYSYYPIVIGSWITYKVQEINIDKPSEVYDTLNYQIKEVIESEFTDAENKSAYRIERFVRFSENNSWILKNVWFSNYTINSIHKVEDNIRYVKLIFPVKVNNKWNGNAYNNLSEQQYEISSIDLYESVNQLEFDSVLTVNQISTESMVDKRVETEKFAKNIGLIFKEQIDIYSDNVIIGVPIENRITIGRLFKMEIIDYGKN